MRVILADDGVLFREGTARILTEAGFEVIGQAGNAEELIDLVRHAPPDVAIVDIRMPPGYSTEGVEAAVKIRRIAPGVGLADPLAALTQRERAVLALMAQGCSNSRLSSELFLSAKTVEAHVRSIFTKLDLPPAPGDHRRVLAVLAYLRS